MNTRSFRTFWYAFILAVIHILLGGFVRPAALPYIVNERLKGVQNAHLIVSTYKYIYVLDQNSQNMYPESTFLNLILYMNICLRLLGLILFYAYFRTSSLVKPCFF